MADIKQVTIAMASDHGGARLKNLIAEHLKKADVTVIDLGGNPDVSSDYPDAAKAVADYMLEHKNALGMLFCGTGIGISIAANRYKHIRAALCHDEFGARLASMHNDANVLVLGGRTTGDDVAIGIVNTWLATEFEGGRHIRRIEKINNM